MSNKLLSEEDVARLSENPNIESVTTRTVIFTPAFKQVAYEQLHSGMTIREILLEHGIDPIVLGDTRIHGLRCKIEALAKRPEGFANLRKTRSPATSDDNEKSLQRQIRELRQELAYTRQEVEFLKKIRMADLEARKQWESMQKQK